MMDISIRDVVKELFQVGFWLGKAGASEHSNAYYRQKDLAIEDCVERLQYIRAKEEKQIEKKGACEVYSNREA